MKNDEISRIKKKSNESRGKKKKKELKIPSHCPSIGMHPMNYPARDNSYSSFSQQVNLCIKRWIVSPRIVPRTSPSHKFEPSIWSISTTMRIQWILRVEWRLVNTSPEDDKRGQLITSLRSRPKSFTDQSGGAVKVVETGEWGGKRKWQKEDEDGEAEGSVSRFSTLTKRDTETWRPKEGW